MGRCHACLRDKGCREGLRFVCSEDSLEGSRPAMACQLQAHAGQPRSRNCQLLVVTGTFCANRRWSISNRRRFGSNRCPLTSSPPLVKCCQVLHVS